MVTDDGMVPYDEYKDDCEYHCDECGWSGDREEAYWLKGEAYCPECGHRAGW